MLLEFFHLFFSESALVRRVALKRERVIWELRGALMVDIIFSILPVRVFCLVVAELCGWGIILRNRTILFFRWLHWESLECSFLSGRLFHLVRIDYTSLLLKVECFLLFKSPRNLILILFLI